MNHTLPNTHKFNSIAFCRLLLTSILAIGLALSSSAQWIQKADGLRKRGECASAIYQGKVYIFGGFGEHPNLDSTNEVYNPATDTWTFIDSFPANKKVSHTGFVQESDNVWLIGGRLKNNRGLVTDQVLIYNITSDTWSNGPSLTDPATGMPLRWAAGAAVYLAGKIHVIGGLVDTFCRGDQSKYHLTLDVSKWKANPAGTTWENNAAPMPLPRNHLSATVLNGMIYVFGGQKDHDCGGSELPFAQTYNPLTNEWTRIGDLPSARSHAEGSTFSMDGKIYIFGGQGPTGLGQNSGLIMDPSGNSNMGSWSPFPITLPFDYLGTSVKYLDDQLILSHGGNVDITDERKETFTTTVTRNPQNKLGFLTGCVTQFLPGNSTSTIQNILYSVEETTNYTLTSNAPWLSFSTSTSGIVTKSGVGVSLVVNSSGLSDGNYSALVEANSTGSPSFINTSFCVNLTVTSSTPSISISAIGQGAVSKSPDQASYTPGTIVTLTATPSVAQKFDGWTGDTASSSNPLKIMAGNQNRNYIANFSGDFINHISSTSGRKYELSQLVTGATTYTDRTYKITSVPPLLLNTSFIRTANDDKNSQATSLLSFDLLRPATIYIAYDPRATVLPAWMNGWKKITDVLGVQDSKISALNLYEKNFNVGSITIGGNLASPAAGSMTNYLVVAKENAFIPSSYILDVTTSGSGTVTKDPDQPSYDEGTVVTLKATPDADQVFTGWSGDVSEATNPLIVAMNANQSIIAKFASPLTTYTITTNISGNGSVSRDPDQADYASGSTVILNATPASGQTFRGWSGDFTGTTNPLSLTMNANKTITATFDPIPSGPLVSNLTTTSKRSYATAQLVVGVRDYTDRLYTVTSVPSFLNNEVLIRTPNDDKTNSSSNILSFDLGMATTVYVAYDPRASVLPGWMSSWQKSPERIGVSDNVVNMDLYYKSFSAGKVTLGGTLASPAVGAQCSYFVVIPAQPHTVQYNLLVSTSGGGTVTKNPDQPSYAAGTTVTLTATPDAGQVFMRWSGDITESTNPLTFTMNSDKSIAATFYPVSNSKMIIFDPTSQAVTIQQGNSVSLLDYISTSDNQPVNAQLLALDNDGNLPTWISVNGKVLDGLNYTTGSEITFKFDATNLSLGQYVAKVYANAPGYDSDTLTFSVTVEPGAPLLNYEINFQDSVTAVPTGFLRDYGQAFGQRISANQGSGNVYGWMKRSDRSVLNLTKNTRNRNTPADVKLATFIHMQANDVVPTTMTAIEGIWEIQLANGNYDVTVSVGEGQNTNSSHTINVEGVNAISNFIPTTSVKFKAATVTVNVSDGFMTVDAIGGTNTKLDYIQIFPSSASRPSVIAVSPDNGATQTSQNTSISTSVLNLPNAGIDNSTITPGNVYLTEETTGNMVLANVNGTGGGDAITLVPSSLLKLNTTYVFHITNGVKDLTGAPFISFTSTFTTGTGSSGAILNAKFDKVDLPNATGRHSSLKVGPDGKLYALGIDGLITRFTINNDGTLSTPDSLYALQDASGTRTPRLAIGLTFDPASTADNLIAYVTNSTFVFLNGPSWDGKLTRLSGNNLQNVQDILINLPRSGKDHLTNSVAFGPDQALYFTQGSLSAMGREDQTWQNRNESLLSGAVLRLDMTKLSTLPLNVKTSDGGGTYNPYSPNAALTIYGSGVRNAYDLVWHTNGSLYVPTNGSAAGGNTPASVAGTLRPDGTTYNGPVIPELTNVQQTQKDFLFRVEKGGYYGHPNPLRGEYVLNGGNPTIYNDAAEVYPYPVGTMPDANYRGYAFDFQNNKSPNGVIEYRNGAFNDALKGKILVVRYSQNDDILTLTPGGAKNDIISSIDGAYVEGFSGFIDPLDLTEDTLTGNIYVSEYGGDGKIVLLRVRPISLTTKPAPLADTSLMIETVASEPVLDSLLAMGTPKAYPNPFHDRFTLDFPSAHKGKYQLKVSDVSGKTIDLGTVNLQAAGQKLEINLSKYNLVKGVYFLRVISAEGRAVVIKLLNY